MASLISGYAGVVCDLDGVVYRGPVAVPHAVPALSALTVPVVYATNNASRTPQEVADHLSELGLPIGPQAVATSAQAGAAALALALGPGARVLAVGGDGVRTALQESGLRVVLPADRPAAVAGVLQGYGLAVTAADLAEAAYAVARGAVWVATNTDATLPTERGTAPGNGALVEAVRTATGVQPLVTGKPFAPLYSLCAERLGLESRSLLALGDRLDTDVAGAAAAGLDSVLVLTGIDSVSALAVAGPGLRPTYLLEDLRGLAEPYLPVTRDGSWWVCGDDRRRLAGGAWEVACPGSPVLAARAGTACLHDALDRDELEPDQVARLAAQLDVWQ